MANPQADNFTKISTELLEALCRSRIPGQARQMLDVIIRKTYGWKKADDHISTTQFMQLTGMKAYEIHKARKKLQDMNIITVTQKGDSQVLCYRLEKDYDKWVLLPKKVTVTKKGNKLSPKKVATVPQKVVHNRYYTIDNKDKYPFLKEKRFLKAFNDFLAMRKQIKRPATEKAQELALKELHKYNINIATAMLEQSIMNSWQGIFPLKNIIIEEKIIRGGIF